MKTVKPSLRYIRVGLACCGDDWIQCESSRYDLERLGCVRAESSEEANLLVIQGNLNEKLFQEAKKVFEQMAKPRFAMAIGTCSCGGGIFPNALDSDLPISVFVTGCPPRPEAIMNGVISLREAQS